jgi:hypothetical protein
MKTNLNREQAIERGDKRYAGSSCKNCGTLLKNVSDHGCVQCNKIRSKKRQAAKRLDGSNKVTRQKYEQGAAGKAARSRYRKQESYKFNSYRHQIKSKFGLDSETFDKMLTEQSGRCIICSSQMDGPRDPCVDHCHSEGHVRGLLCWSCNIGLGHFKDNIASLEKAIDYLKG